MTGIALNTTFRTLFGGLSLLPLIIGHATFCVVIVLSAIPVSFARRLAGDAVCSGEAAHP